MLSFRRLGNHKKKNGSGILRKNLPALSYCSWLASTSALFHRKCRQVVAHHKQIRIEAVQLNVLYTAHDDGEEVEHAKDEEPIGEDSRRTLLIDA